MQKTSFWDIWLPHPFVSVIVAISWLLLAHSVSAGNLLMALILSILIPLMVKPFIARTPNIHWVPAFKLFWVVVCWDPPMRCIRNGSVCHWRPSMNRSTPCWR